MNDFTGRTRLDERTPPAGSVRTITVALDTAQYQVDWLVVVVVVWVWEAGEGEAASGKEARPQPGRCRRQGARLFIPGPARKHCVAR